MFELVEDSSHEQTTETSVKAALIKGICGFI